jgi:hypothetical protein
VDPENKSFRYHPSVKSNLSAHLACSYSESVSIWLLQVGEHPREKENSSTKRSITKGKDNGNPSSSPFFRLSPYVRCLTKSWLLGESQAGISLDERVTYPFGYSEEASLFWENGIGYSPKSVE